MRISHGWRSINYNPYYNLCCKCNNFRHIEKYRKLGNRENRIDDKKRNAKDNHKRKTIKFWRVKKTKGEEETNARKDKAWKF